MSRIFEIDPLIQLAGSERKGLNRHQLLRILSVKLVSVNWHQKSSAFLKFSGGIEMKHFSKICL